MTNTDHQRKPKTKVLIGLDVQQEALEKLQEGLPPLDFVIAVDAQTLEKEIVDAEILIVFTCPSKLLEKSPALRWIHILRSGMDGTDVGAIRKRDILLTNSKGIHRHIMAEYALAAMIMMSRNWPEMFREQAKKSWNSAIPQDKIQGKTLGIVGYGVVGKEIANRALQFGMQVRTVRRGSAQTDAVQEVSFTDSLEELLPDCDYVINLLPLNHETQYTFDHRLFSLMRKDAVFLNLGRGGTVVEEELIHALSAKMIRGAVLDVFQEEPLSPDSPLWNLENVIITPHQSGSQSDYFSLAIDLIRENLEHFIHGTGEQMVNKIR